MIRKHPKRDLKLGFRKRSEAALGLALALMVVLFYGARHAGYQGELLVQQVNLDIEVADIPQTEQIHRPPPPARPVVAIPTESEEIPADVTIASTELDLSELPPPPPPPRLEEESVDENFVFVPYDEPPEMIGGSAALLAHLVYPELARKAGVEGMVMIGALIDVDGVVKKTMVIKDSGTKVGFEEAALKAVMQTKWKPAKQRDRVVKVWMAIPVRFKLKESLSS